MALGTFPGPGARLVRTKGKRRLEWLAPTSWLVSGLPLALIAYPMKLEELGVMDRDMAAGFTMLFSILLIPLGLVVWAATVLISVATLIWGANRLRLRTLIWYLC